MFFILWPYCSCPNALVTSNIPCPPARDWGSRVSDLVICFYAFSCLCFCTLTFVCILFPLSYTSCVNKWHEYISNITPISHHIRVVIDWNRKDGRHSWDGKRENMSNWADTCAYSRANTRGQRRKSCPKMIEVGQNLKAKSKGKIYKQNLLNLQAKCAGKMYRKNLLTNEPASIHPRLHAS